MCSDYGRAGCTQRWMHTASRKKDKTKHSVSSMLYSYPTETPLRYTKDMAQICAWWQMKHQGRCLKNDEKVTVVNIFDHEDHSVGHRGIHNTFSREHERESRKHEMKNYIYVWQCCTLMWRWSRDLKTNWGGNAGKRAQILRELIWDIWARMWEAGWWPAGRSRAGEKLC